MEDGPLAKLKASLQKNYGLTINPYLKSGFEFTNNVFKTPKPYRRDEIWTLTPGINATYTNQYGESGLSFESPYHYFTRHSEENVRDQSFAAFTDLHPNDQINIKLSEELTHTGGTSGARNVEPLQSLDNSVKAGVTYDVTDKASVEAGYKNFMREFNGEFNDAFNYSENEFYGEGFYTINEQIKPFIGYHLGFIHYDETRSRNATYHEFPIGARGILPWGQVQYEAGTGLYFRNQQADARNDLATVIWNANLKKQFTERTAATLGFSRHPVESTFDDAETSDDNRLYTNITHRLTERLRLRIDSSYTNKHFDHRSTVGPDTVRRNDNIFSLGMGFDFALRKWMIYNIDYRLERRNSNLTPFDYTENRIVTGVTIPL